MSLGTLRFALLASLVMPGLALAAGGTTVDLGTSVLQMVLGLAAVLILAVGGLYVLKRLTAPRGPAAGLLRVVAAAAVGSRERVVVVELADTWLVLGVAPGRVTSLSQLPRLESGAPPAPGGAPGRDFAGWLKQVMDRRNAR